LLEHSNWELFDNPPHSPDRTPSDYHLFTWLKNWLGSQHFNNNEELMEGARAWLSSRAADFFDTGILVQKLIPRYKCLNSGDDYVQKKLKYVRIFSSHGFFINISPEVTFRIALVYNSVS
jgi:hypothetical protein